MGISEELAIGLLSLVGSLAGTFGGILTSNRLTGYRIEQLEKKVEKHNGIIERVYRLEDNDRLLEEKITGVDKRVEKLEKNVTKEG